MKKIIFVLLVILLSSTAISQVWFQASVEYKLNKYSGTSISNELGYTFMLSESVSLSPSIDYTYFSNGETTETLLFQCLSITKSVFPSNDFIPYISFTVGHLNTFPAKQNCFGWSVQPGVSVVVTPNTQLFLQYRYFEYKSIISGQLTQFGFMYIFGG